MALQVIMAVLMSMMDGPARKPGRSGSPFSDMKPLSAWVMGSNPSRSFKGPERP